MRRRTLLLSAAALLLPVTGAGAAATTLEVFKDAGCGCCEGWIAHMRQHGFTVAATDVAPEHMGALKTAAGIGPGVESCHTALIEGYVVEGHVPAADVTRLLAERPDAVGLAAPGMPIGSPGMEGGGAESYDVLLIRPDGSTEVFARH